MNFVKIHSQNLNERKGIPAGSMFWHGRAWIRNRSKYDELFHVEWGFGKHARDWAIKMSFGYGDSDSGICLHACIPFLFSVYLVIPHVYHCKESVLGIATHSGAIWLYTFTDAMETRSDFPWWKKSHSWYFPWTLDHYKTEILTHDAPEKAMVMWHDRGKKFMDSYEERKRVEAEVAKVYDYEYQRKNGEIQQRKAAVHVDRMEWRARWWPIIPIKKISTSIWVDFNEEIGEEVGTWKGGTTGCGYSMLPGETPLMTLRRMERERKFQR